MNSSILKSSLEKDNYDEYIENALNIFRLSSKESSIILNIKINNDNCIINLSIINQSGETKNFSDVTFKCDDVFYNDFICNLVRKIYSECDIVKFDSISNDQDDRETFRMITDNNDLFTIEGIDKDKSEGLVSLCSNYDEIEDSKVKLLSNVGFGNYSVLILLVIIIILIFILIWMIIK